MDVNEFQICGLGLAWGRGARRQASLSGEGAVAIHRGQMERRIVQTAVPFRASECKT